jgi:hypothetical protein
MSNTKTESLEGQKFVWSVAIFTAREQAAELKATIDAVVAAASARTLIDVLVNGNPALAKSIASLVALESALVTNTVIRVWSIELGGKAHAWNQHVHTIWQGAELTFFVDGYARIKPNALQLLAEGMASATGAIAGTGVPSSGRTATLLREHTLRDGGLHGCFFALTANAMDEFRRQNIRLPLGLYGFDTLLGAILGFGLDPLKNRWDVKRFIYVHPEVTWTIDEKKWWRYAVVKTQLKRILNNALRLLVAGATKDHLAQRKMPPNQIPRTTEEFVLSWAKNNPKVVRRTLWKSPLSWIVLRRLSEPKDWSSANKPPTLIYVNSILG